MECGRHWPVPADWQDLSSPSEKGRGKGGLQNQAAGDYSFAAGRRAKVEAAQSGTFLFADANDFAFPVGAANEFAVRATGGVRLVSAVDSNGQPIAGVEMPPGSGSWSVPSA